MEYTKVYNDMIKKEEYMDELLVQEREFLQILDREEHNVNRVYLCKKNGCWYAYEKSAYFFWFWLADSHPLEKVVNTLYSVCLVRISLPDIVLQQKCLFDVNLISENEAYLDVPMKVKASAFDAWKEMVWRKAIPTVQIQSA